MGFTVCHQTPELLVFSFENEISKQDAQQMCGLVERRLLDPTPFGIMTYADRATRLATPEVRELFLQHASVVRAIERRRNEQTLRVHSIWISSSSMTTFSTMKMQMGNDAIIRAFLTEEQALNALQVQMATAGIALAWQPLEPSSASA